MQRIVFMGTPEFAVPTLEALVDACRVVGVVTQPDRRAGRGRKLTPPPVKRAALAHELPVYQPQSMRAEEALNRLRAWEPTVIVVTACGYLLPPAVLDLPPKGCVNVHASLLPRWRGASPVAAAILAGDAVTGVTVMRMDEGLDTGPILAQREVPIRPTDNQAALEARLAQVGAELLIETLPRYLADELAPRPQPEAGVTYAPRLQKSDGLLAWERSARALERQVRAYDPWPGTFTFWEQRRFKVLEAAARPEWRGSAAPGTVIELPDGVGVATGEGALKLVRIQMAGKRPMRVEPFLQGHRDFVGSHLGSRDGSV